VRRYRKPENREFVATISNGKTIKVIAPHLWKALQRADMYCERQEDDVTVTALNEITVGEH
jgi:hypothetical protein